jgi:hypothetical protein
MALNAVRFLGEVAHDSRLTLEHIKHGLNHSKVGDTLDFQDWQRLSKAESRGEAGAIAFEILPRYWKEWERLGQPRTAEEWHARLDVLLGEPDDFDTQVQCEEVYGA